VEKLTFPLCSSLKIEKYVLKSGLEDVRHPQSVFVRFSGEKLYSLGQLS